MEENIYNELKELKIFLIEILKKVEQGEIIPEIKKEWISKDELKKLLGFGETQLNKIIRKNNLTYTEIGKKKFYTRKSVENLFQIS
jgi:hypothetical protein